MPYTTIRIKIAKFLLPLLFMGWLGTSSIAQEIGIKGQVTDLLDGSALTGANIFLKSNIGIGTTSDGSGNFGLSLPEGVLKDTLIISFIGYQELMLPIHSENQAFLAIKLRPLVNQMEEIVVAAPALISEEFTIQKIKKLEIYLNPSAKADPLLAVNALPAASTLDESANISLRGSTPAETGIFFNNVPIYDAIRFGQLNGIGTFSIFNTIIVNKLNVFPGNPPLEYGNTTSGLIAIESESNIPKKGSHSAVLSMANLGISSNIKTGENSSLILFANYQPSFLIKKINQDALESLKSFNAADLGIHYYQKIGKKTHYKIFSYALEEGYKFTLNAPSFQGDFNQAKSRVFSVINFNHRINHSIFTINQGLSFSKSRFHYSKAAIQLRQNDLFTSFNYQYLGDDFSVKTGISYDGRRSKFNGLTPIYSYAIGPSAPFEAQNNSDETKVPEIYFYAKYYINEQWIIGAGVRRNAKNQRVGDYYSYQANISYKKGLKHEVNASIGRYHQFTLPDRDFPITTFVQSHQLAVDYKFKHKGLEQDISVFYKTSKWNNSQREIAGIELFSKFRFSNAVNAGIAYTFLNTKVLDGEFSYPSQYDMDYFIKGNISFKWKSLWTFTSNFTFRQGALYQPIKSADFDAEVGQFRPNFYSKQEQSRYPAYNLVDISATKMWPITEDLVLIGFTSIGNLFNFKNVRNYDYSFDYSERTISLFSKRVTYFGVILNF